MRARVCVCAVSLLVTPPKVATTPVQLSKQERLNEMIDSKAGKQSSTSRLPKETGSRRCSPTQRAPGSAAEADGREKQRPPSKGKAVDEATAPGVRTTVFTMTTKVVHFL